MWWHDEMAEEAQQVSDSGSGTMHFGLLVVLVVFVTFWAGALLGCLGHETSLTNDTMQTNGVE